jgi:hypothetical protein
MRINVVGTATTGCPVNGPVIVSPALTAIQYELPDGGNGRPPPAHGTARGEHPGRYRRRRVSGGYCCVTAARPASSRATGTRNGEQDT